MKEAKNIRRLAQEVLLQRSDVETFFISSLQHVRDEIAKERGSCPTPPGKKIKQVDIAELSWRDRETVLRLAFAKINNQAQNRHLRTLPKHSFTVEQAVRMQVAEEFIPSDTLQGLVSDAGKPQLV